MDVGFGGIKFALARGALRTRKHSRRLCIQLSTDRPILSRLLMLTPPPRYPHTNGELRTSIHTDDPDKTPTRSTLPLIGEEDPVSCQFAPRSARPIFSLSPRRGSQGQR
jgi:hypothetical protein